VNWFLVIGFVVGVAVLIFYMNRSARFSKGAWVECSTPDRIKHKRFCSDKGLYYIKGRSCLYRITCEHDGQHQYEFIVKCERRLRRLKKELSK